MKFVIGNAAKHNEESFFLLNTRFFANTISVLICANLRNLRETLLLHLSVSSAGNFFFLLLDKR